MRSPDPYRQEREKMVKKQLRKRNIRRKPILDAFLQIPRERFVPPDLWPHAYEDRALPIGHDVTISQPFVVAWMLTLLDLRPSDRVLEVGSGSGYVLALLSRLVREVYGIERVAELAESARARLHHLGVERVTIKWGDGHNGWPEKGPFDKILVSAGGPEVPTALKEQLAVGGRLILPLGQEPQDQVLLQVDRLDRDDYNTKKLGRVRFVPLLSGTAEPDEKDEQWV